MSAWDRSGPRDMLSLSEERVLSKAELNANVDSEHNHGGSSEKYVLRRIGCSQEAISYRIKAASGQVQGEARSRRGSVKMTERHYLPWVKARQKQLTTSVQRAWFPEVRQNTLNQLPFLRPPR